ncbi:isochorismate synthase [Tepidiforma sp.]|uniref:isochorismate synthase n=1 Tax=Tepidiforma sp. TaxID=2682230 RepID=UPI002ADE4944|nr:isochorismate synthase [Tepidiforma sp.]
MSTNTISPVVAPGRIARGLTVNPLSAATVEWYRARGELWLREHATVTWERPAADVQVFGLGTAVRVIGQRGDGIAALREQVAPLLENLAAAAAELPFAPRVFAVAAFDPGAPRLDPAWEPLGSYQVIIPAITLLRCGESWSGIACAGDFPAAVPGADLGLGPCTDAAHLEQAIMAAVGEIREGRYQKAVLAGCRLVPTGGLRPSFILARLGAAFPTCCIFSIRAGGLAWLGATPEPLALVHQGKLDLFSLAGSRRRGATPDEDERLANELLASPKERWEHQLVLDAIRGDLAGLATDLQYPETPRVMKLANIQHLSTPISARLVPGRTILDVVERLHPTPAVGGWPRAEALDAIRRLEAMDRGWYAGPIGWVDANGDGEFYVALRSALVGGNVARLYAGAGIVADSDPAAELDEIETKLDALRGVMTR